MTARRLMQAGRLPERPKGERVAHMDADVRELAAKMRATLTEKAAAYTVTGYTLDEDSWEFVANGRSVVLTVVLRRDE